MDSQNLQLSKRLRILMFPLPFQGHINPMIQLAQILHSKGFEITIIHTKYNSLNPSSHPQFKFIAISDNLSEAEVSSLPPIRIVQHLLTACVEPFEKCLAQLLSEDLNNEVACLVADGFLYFTQAVADKFKIPRIVLQVISVCSVVGFTALPLLRERGYLSDMDSKLETPILELPPLRVKDIPLFRLIELEEAYEFTVNMVDETKKSSGLIVNSFDEFEGPELAKLRDDMQCTVPSFAIGPFHRRFSASTSSLLTQDRSCISWLDKQAPKSVLYVSFGSIVQLDEKALHEMAWGLAKSKQPFLWAVRPGFVLGSPSDQWIESALPGELLDLVKERSCMVKWSPQQEVLSHRAVGGFWTHSGWNSMIESICEGVPMICSYFSGDQKVNSRYANDVWKIGIKLEKGIEREEIEDSIRKLMKGIEGEEMRERVMALKEKSELCLKPGGSSNLALDALVRHITSFRTF